MSMDTRNNREMDWNDYIENDGLSYLCVEEGDYPFTIVAFDKGRHSPRPNGVIPACNKIKLTVRIENNEHEPIDIPHQLFLHVSQEWKLCQFFTSIGARKKGERLQMDWDHVVGATGMCHVKPMPYKGNDGEEHMANTITKWWPAKADTSSASSNATQATVPNPYPARPVFQEGKF